jgi:hypothetical protein
MKFSLGGRREGGEPPPRQEENNHETGWISNVPAAGRDACGIGHVRRSRQLISSARRAWRDAYPKREFGE